jgi:hypothetical protein
MATQTPPNVIAQLFENPPNIRRIEAREAILAGREGPSRKRRGHGDAPAVETVAIGYKPLPQMES